MTHHDVLYLTYLLIYKITTDVVPLLVDALFQISNSMRGINKCGDHLSLVFEVISAIHIPRLLVQVICMLLFHTSGTKHIISTTVSSYVSTVDISEHSSEDFVSRLGAGSYEVEHGYKWVKFFKNKKHILNGQVMLTSCIIISSLYIKTISIRVNLILMKLVM